MQIGAVFPQTEIGPDAGAVRAYAVRVQELGFAHILAYDHVLGADPAVHSPWRGNVRSGSRLRIEDVSLIAGRVVLRKNLISTEIRSQRRHVD